LRNIYGPTELTDGAWRTRTNEELENLIQHKNIIHFTEAQRFSWLGHVERVPEEKDVNKTCEWKLIASRPVGRPKIRWMQNVTCIRLKTKLNSMV
jgi:hypothetical protein